VEARFCNGAIYSDGAANGSAIAGYFGNCRRTRCRRHGAEFVRSIEREHNVTIQVISGERESELAAKGILTSVHEPLGMSADSGGGSMEVAPDRARARAKPTSLHLGSLRAPEESDGRPAQMEKILTQQLSNVSWLKDAHPHIIYAIMAVGFVPSLSCI